MILEGLGASRESLGAVLGDLGVVLGCPWPLFGDLGAAGGDFELIWGRFGVDLGSIWSRFGLICWICIIFFGCLAFTQSNVPQVSQTLFQDTNSLKGDPQKI